MKTPNEPGIYYDLPFDVYRDIDAINSSLIKAAAKSLLEVQRKQEAFESPSYALALGRAFALLCESQKAFFATVVAMTEVKTPTSEKWQKAASEQPEKIFLLPNDVDMLVTMHDFARRHPFAKQVFGNSEGYFELSLVWDDADTGIRMKARIDRFTAGRVWDIKTVAKGVTARKIEFQIRDFGYDLQLAMYHDGLTALADDANMLPVFQPGLIFVEKRDTLPDVAVRLFNETEMKQARQQYKQLAVAIEQARKTGYYPGIDGGEPIEPIDWDGIETLEPTNATEE